MNTRLNHIQNWPELAQAANWSASALAKKCDVSVRTLERYFRKELSKTPKAWLSERRQGQAIELLRDGFSVKETAARLGYKQAGNFSRKFAKHWGVCPTMEAPRIKLLRATCVV
jgi:transcriptional regulator GlxA family with amidase domain